MTVSSSNGINDADSRGERRRLERQAWIIRQLELELQKMVVAVENLKEELCSKEK